MFEMMVEIDKLQRKLDKAKAEVSELKAVVELLRASILRKQAEKPVATSLFTTLGGCITEKVAYDAAPMDNMPESNSGAFTFGSGRYYAWPIIIGHQDWIVKFTLEPEPKIDITGTPDREQFMRASSLLRSSYLVSEALWVAVLVQMAAKPCNETYRVQKWKPSTQWKES